MEYLSTLCVAANALSIAANALSIAANELSIAANTLVPREEMLRAFPRGDGDTSSRE